MKQEIRSETIRKYSLHMAECTSRIQSEYWSEFVILAGGTRQDGLDTIITVITTTKDQGLATRLATSSRFRDTRIIPIRHSTIIGTECEVQDSNDNSVEENTVQR